MSTTTIRIMAEVHTYDLGADLSALNECVHSGDAMGAQRIYLAAVERHMHADKAGASE